MKIFKKPIKISKRTIVTAAIVVLLIGIPVAYYFWVKSQESVEAWYSSSWLYRRSISVGNTTGGTLTNEDVLISLDTSTMVSAGKLRSDCGDLRFVDGDDSTLLTYWIEGGCNTTSTKVWVRIPSLPNGGKTIYMYYSNASATTSEASWSGNFILTAALTCPTGWTVNTAFDNYFIYGSTTYGSTGGTSGIHNHGGTVSFATGDASAYSGVGGDSGSQCGNFSPSTHTIGMTISSADSTPPYLYVRLCQRNKLTDLGGLQMISDSSTPSGWSRFTGLDGKFPYGTNSSEGMLTGGSTTHSHSISNISIGQSSYRCGGINMPDPNARTISKYDHTHSISLASNASASNMPPYKIMLYVQAPSNTTTLNYQLVSMTSSVPPLGWTQYTTLNNVFVLGGSSANTTTQGSTSHTHAISFNIGTPSATQNLNASSMLIAGPTHTHSANYTTSSVSNIPPYKTVIYAKRKTSQTTTINSEEIYDQLPNAPTSLLAEGTSSPQRVTDLTPEFSAIFSDPDSGDTSSYYQIQVNTNSSFTGTTMWDSGKASMSAVANGARISDKSYAGTALSLNGTTYYWRIRLWDSKDWVSSWSSTASFRMNTTPSTPSSLLTEGQTNPTRVTDLTPEFSAVFSDPDSGDTSSYYEIQVNTQSDFNGDYMWQSGQTSISAIANGARSSDISYAGTTLLLNGNTYYWKIRFWDNSGTVSAWSAVASFQIDAKPNPPSSLLTEGATNPKKVYDTTPEFSAIFSDTDTSDTAIYYQIVVYDGFSFYGVVLWDSGKTSVSPITNGDRSPDISYAGNTLSLNGSLRSWIMRFWDQNDVESNWSSQQYFIMSGVPDTPTDLKVDNQTNPTVLTSLTPQFSSTYTDPNEDDALYYEIQVNSASDFTGNSIWSTGKTSTTVHDNSTFSITYGGTSLLSTGNTYYWRIRFWDVDDNVSPWSTTAQFVDNVKSIKFEGLKLEGIQIN